MGFRELTPPPSCVSDADCPASANACSTVSCGDAGQCVRVQLANGSHCETSAGGPGRCTYGLCVLDQQDALSGRETCKKRRRYGQTVTKCSRGLRYRLPVDKLMEESEKLREQISKVVRYDVLAGLVALPGGGYNIVATNLRTRDDVRGLVDPSFVAFTAASFTSSSRWKSGLLQIWLFPYSEGWMIPTKGTRLAQRKGKEASGLGWLGVVDVKAYRTWLEKTFQALPRSPTSLECPPAAVFPIEDMAAGATGARAAPSPQPVGGAELDSQEIAPANVPGWLEDWMGLCRRELYRNANSRSELDRLVGSITAAVQRLDAGCTPELSQLVHAVERDFENCSQPVRQGCRYLTGYVVNTVIDQCLTDVSAHVRSAFDRKVEDYGEPVKRAQCLAAEEASRTASSCGAMDEEIQSIMSKCGRVLAQVAKEEEEMKAAQDVQEQ